MNKVKVWANGKQVEHLPLAKLVCKPRYSRLPQFLMRWRRFRIEYVVPDYTGVEIQGDAGKAGDMVMTMYEVRYKL